MSKSRLEKFLYALYSLDPSDLPTPLSRIEELYKCLVTGDEAPTFEPLSRVEKYLMAILGAYDADELPNPLSRVEVLLYKLATGDDNLDDVKSFLSEHEELLAEIIRNGGVGGNIDIEYVLYTLSTKFSTLYNTAEKPIKSAILKGKTLVNLATPIEYKTISYHGYCLVFNGSMLKSGKYTLKSSVDFSQYVVNLMSTQKDKPARYSRITIKKNGVFTIDDTFFVANNVKAEDFFICLRPIDSTESGTVTTDEIENCEVILLEGDYTNVDIPYFTGMQSVKMPVLTTTGKNLFNPLNFKNGELVEINGEKFFKYVDGAKPFEFTTDFETNKQYTITFSAKRDTGDETKDIYLYVDYTDGSRDYRIINGSGVDVGTITTSVNKTISKICGSNGFSKNVYINLNVSQLEEGSIATSYEPHKSNILSTPEDLELRGIGNVQDTLDCLTGEVTQSIYQITLTGNESGYGYNTAPSVDTDFHGTLSIGGANLPLNKKLVAPISNRFQGALYGANKTWQCCIGGSYSLHFFIPKTELETSNINGFKNWVKQQYLDGNPIKVAYILEEKSIKTVDLSTVNQDGNNTELKTFEDITYVTLSSEGPIPEAELEVATKNEEVLNTLSLEMDDISTTQNALQETTNTQSENVDATMMATTEIYEQLL